MWTVTIECIFTPLIQKKWMIFHSNALTVNIKRKGESGDIVTIK